MAQDMSDTVPLAGVVLAGGESRRMGRDKATLPYPGGTVTLVEHVLGVVGQRCNPVFVMAAPGQPLPPLEVRVIRDEVRGLGPLPALGRGLRAAAQAGAEFAFVSAVDMPSLTVELIDDLAQRAAVTNADVVLPWDGRSHYLAAVYRTELADRVEALVAAGQRRMSALVDASDAQQIVMSDSRPLANVNSMTDLSAVRALV
ncbi:molybdenum cofactor guanylyltransferase [Mycobacterium spongiae]|uniref:Probable molybdenum cofactor guanylyltransferase n=2 Tax=Mycobacterium spongiae TaxID=886343 RepID=A0A975K3R3_9MYCO|nr:molybdenum cofactor guanylyltransferase [Mycobacterium spongiae]QUR69859.1 molybdenum cofactor guanylyltransferase [Mycobacterium spongiae]